MFFINKIVFETYFGIFVKKGACTWPAIPEPERRSREEEQARCEQRVELPLTSQSMRPTSGTVRADCDVGVQMAEAVVVEVEVSAVGHTVSRIALPSATWWCRRHLFFSKGP